MTVNLNAHALEALTAIEYELATNPDVTVRRKLASGNLDVMRRLSRNLQMALAYDSDINVRMCLAGQHLLPDDIQLLLARDLYEVRLMLAENRSICFEAQVVLLESSVLGCDYVRDALHENPAFDYVAVTACLDEQHEARIKQFIREHE